jgi:methyltransferase family protein
MGADQVLRATVPMLGAAEALAALGASLRLRREGSKVDPELAARLDAVLDALGVGGAVNALDKHEMVALLGIVEGFLAQAADFVVAPGRAGWDHEEPSILLAQGHTSALIAPVLRRFVVPALGRDLTQRLDDSEAAFLDVGVGVAALSVALCRAWPSLRVVGIDPWEPALVLAREYVAAAGLEERIELREMAAETLEDAEAYDLAWVPTFFISGAVLERVIERVHVSLRRGGWVLLGFYARPGDPLRDALADLRTVRHGGSLLTPAQAAAQLKHAGYCDVDVHFEAEWELPVVYVAGRRGDAR